MHMQDYGSYFPSPTHPHMHTHTHTHTRPHKSFVLRKEEKHGTPNSNCQNLVFVVMALVGLQHHPVNLGILCPSLYGV